MQENSIQKPVHVEHGSTETATPVSGDNFTFITSLDGVTDQIALLEAIDFLDDCAVALAAFEQSEQCTGTP